MAGKGSRFEECGYQLPKPLIEINEKPFFYYATESIIGCCKIVTSLTFIALQEHENNFDISSKIKLFYPQAQIIFIKEVLNGSVLTALNVCSVVKNNEAVVFNDCDHYFCSKALTKFLKNSNDFDGALLTFFSKNPSYSYCQEGQNGIIEKTVEKVAVSNKAICGTYCFRNISYFKKMAKIYLSECSYKEFFMSGIYNSAILRGGKFVAIATDLHLSFGTPQELENVIKNKALIF